MPRWTDEMKEKALALKGTKTIRQIAQELGVSKTSVGLIMKNKDEVVETSETSETIPTNTIEMIGDKEASDFLKSVSTANGGEGQNERASQVIDNLMAGIPIAEHITPPFKARRKQAEARVTAQREPKTPKPRAVRERAVAVPDDPAIKADLIGKISFNVNTFESLLADVIRGDKDRFLNGLEKHSVASLEITLKTIETTRSVKNIANQFMNIFAMGSSFVEMGTQKYLKMNTQGFTQAMLQTQQEELRLIMTELAMEQKDKVQKIQRPEVRLAMIMTTTLMAVSNQNNLNSLKSKGQPAPEQKSEQKPEQKSEPKIATTIIPEDKVRDYKDL